MRLHFQVLIGLWNAPICVLLMNCSKKKFSHRALHFVDKIFPKLSLLNKNCYKDGDKSTKERWMYLNQIIITSTGNDANFYPIAGFFCGLFFFVKKSEYLHTPMVIEISLNRYPLVENQKWTSECALITKLLVTIPN